MVMQLNGFGAQANVAMQVDPTYDAGRISIKPEDWLSDQSGAGGHYQIGAMTGLMAAGIVSLSQIFQVRWASTDRKFILKRLTVQFSTATGFAATSLGCPVDLIRGRGATDNGTGGLALQPVSNSHLMRKEMSASAFVNGGEIRIATTGALGAATGQTLEPAALAMCMGADNRTLVSTPPFDLFVQREFGSHPLVLENGETLVLRAVNPAATGTWYMSVLMSWMEAMSY